jgi:hypothetical protein
MDPSPGYSSPPSSNNANNNAPSSGYAFDSLMNSSKLSSQQQHPSLPSLTSIENLLIAPPASLPPQLPTLTPKPTAAPANNTNAAKNNFMDSSAKQQHTSSSDSKKDSNVLSDSSSGDESSSSSSSDDDDDDSSSMEEVDADPDKIPLPGTIINSGGTIRDARSVSPAPPAMVNMSMPSFSSLTSLSQGPSSKQQYSSPALPPQHHYHQPPPPAPPVGLLNDDLQLSESGSDSDD